MVTRREFLEASGVAPFFGQLAWAAPADGPRRKRLAIIANVWTYLSHAQHIGDRFIVGYPFEGKWRQPDIELVSLYVDQTPQGRKTRKSSESSAKRKLRTDPRKRRGNTDQSRQRAQEFGFTIYPTVAETLQNGTDDLAVDAVVIIGEHGDYPRNHKGQILYPRYEYFRQVVDVFDKTGQSVPVFNDKHLSYSFDQAQEMVAASRRLGFPMLAGSSLPVTWRLPAIDVPLDCVIEDTLMVGVGSSDVSDYHALEAMQCMVERRRGGETGVKSVQLVEGDAVWQAGVQGRWSKELLEAALSRAHIIRGITLIDARPQDMVNSGVLPQIVQNPSAYFIEYADGLRATLLMLNGAVGDFNFAARVRGMEKLQSTQFLLPTSPNVTYSACLVNKIVEMIETGRAPYPVERTLLVSGILDKCLDSRLNDHQPVETPELNVRYQPPRESQFCRT